ncbi:hypothetical protein [Caulobacter segnis]|uniref:hypothetical protein n=1 Tax=Caulobacter segnis TaxID=88688 RepID=UPI001CBE7BD5|nr:hypothetical protein [Caulobacter segnis]UAL08778.1 hypothetical protein K8940_13270 [Caulobacter segnis]
MPTIVSLSRAFLTLAAWVAPPNRRTMCQAMRAELDVLDEGRLSWALGGLASALGWRMRVDGLFWAAVLATGLLWDRVTFFAEAPVFETIKDGGQSAILGLWLVEAGLGCALLAAWRPGATIFIALSFFTLRAASAMYGLLYVLGAPMDGNFNVMNAPAIVGFSATFCWCLIGAWAGATLRRTFARPSPAGPA